MALCRRSGGQIGGLRPKSYERSLSNFRSIVTEGQKQRKSTSACETGMFNTGRVSQLSVDRDRLFAILDKKIDNRFAHEADDFWFIYNVLIRKVRWLDLSGFFPTQTEPSGDIDLPYLGPRFTLKFMSSKGISV